MTRTARCGFNACKISVTHPARRCKRHKGKHVKKRAPRKARRSVRAGRAKRAVRGRR